MQKCFCQVAITHKRLDICVMNINNIEERMSSVILLSLTACTHARHALSTSLFTTHVVLCKIKTFIQNVKSTCIQLGFEDRKTDRAEPDAFLLLFMYVSWTDSSAGLWVENNPLEASALQKQLESLPRKSKLRELGLSAEQVWPSAYF